MLFDVLILQMQPLQDLGPAKPKLRTIVVYSITLNFRQLIPIILHQVMMSVNLKLCKVKYFRYTLMIPFKYYIVLEIET